ncbi:hypothetical protein Tsp_11999 [Trichinella spiralis]|uniref:hypothetical protein n=1 Tax=Trichinella spiralis TaxID=6334 RepID=UPI0001EFCD8E|nr:hypothetical protein Tsp_11999 [Trichinella spiralis]
MEGYGSLGWACSVAVLKVVVGIYCDGSIGILVGISKSVLISSVKRELGNKGQQERQQPYVQYDYGDETTGRLTFPCHYCNENQHVPALLHNKKRRSCRLESNG